MHFQKTVGLSLCCLRCRLFFNVTIAINNCKRLLKKNTALSKSQATAADSRGKECASFLTRNARPNFTLPRLSRESCRQGATDRGIFSCNENSRAKGATTVFCLCCAFLLTFCATKSKDRCNYYPNCNKRLRVKNYRRIKKYYSNRRNTILNSHNKRIEKHKCRTKNVRHYI